MWFLLAVGAAITHAIATVARHIHSSSARPVELTWWSMLISMPIAAAWVIIDDRPLYTSYDFLIPALTSALICTATSVLMYAAYKYGEVSAITPLSNLLPLLMIFTSFVMLGTKPSAYGYLGIVLTVVGVYYTGVSGKHALFHPLKQLTKNRGSRLMLTAVVLWSVSGNLDKMALESVSPTFLVLIYQTVIFTLLTIFLLITPPKRGIKHMKMLFTKYSWHFVAVAVGTTTASIMQSMAIAITDNPSYVLAIKRLETLIVVVIAYYFLHEKHFGKRFTGSILAVLGCIVILFA